MHRIERRNHPRVKVSHTLLYSSDVYSRPQVGSTLDLSMGGTKIKTPYCLTTGEKLEISIAISPKVIKCRGEVVHVLDLKDETPKAGIRFEDLSEEDRLFLGEYVSNVTEQGG